MIVSTAITVDGIDYYPCDQASIVVSHCSKYNNIETPGDECEACDNGYSLAANACTVLPTPDENCVSNANGAACE